jgi:thiosulfate/3-mercaptopyruvate sulfurtransferase
MDPMISIHPLIDAPSLERLRHAGKVVIVDVRHDLMKPEAGAEAYAAAHIPGAFFLHLDHDLSGPQRKADGGFAGRHPLPDRATLARRLGALGVGEDTMLVAYDEADGMYASRLWWMSLWLGHASAAVLDGGLRAWKEAGLPVTPEVPRAAPRELPLREPLVRTVEAADIERALGTSRLRVIDARAPERYRGDVEPLDARAGHIPGAVNRPFKMNVGANGRFRPADELRRDFAPLVGGTPPDAVVSQCGSGVTACHNILAMAVAGMPLPRLYAGSWSEWSSSPQRPVATGDAA